VSDAPTKLVHRAFFGDAERDFALDALMIGELERVTGAGIGAIFKRLFANQFSHRDILETIRLGLIGGGEKPAIAASLVHVYAENQPINSTLPLALAILETLFFGKASGANNEQQ